MPAKYSVYIPCRNCGDFVAEAIESVLRQTERDWELIVVDDGSTDHTAEALDPYRGVPGITIHRTEGIGLPRVCNLALAEAKGEYLIRLDGDDVFDENILLVLGRQLDLDPSLALVFPDYYLMDRAGNVFAHERRRRLYRDDHLLDQPPNGACILARRQVLLDLGGYREDLGAQDGLDLWTRIRDRYKTANVNLPLFYYRRHDTNLTTNHSLIINARRQIKRDAAEQRLAAIRPVVAVIPCRRHYDFVPEVWKLELAGQTLLEHSVRACLASDMIDHVVVASDDPEAEAAVRSFGESRLHFVLRDPHDTIRSASLVPTLEKAVRPFDPEMRGIVLVRYLQTPLVTTGTMEEAITTLAGNDADAAVGVTEFKDHMLYGRDGFGLRQIANATGFGEGTFYADARTCTAVRSRNIARGAMTGPAMVGFVIAAFESFFIGSHEHLDLARLIWKTREEGGQ